MAISKDSKDILKKEIERLEGQKAIADKRIKKLGDKREALLKRSNSIDKELQNLKSDAK